LRSVRRLWRLIEAILSDNPPLEAQNGSDYGIWRFALKFGYDLLGINSPIFINPPDQENRGDGKESTIFISRFGGRAEVNFRFPFNFFITSGVDYIINYANKSGDLHTISGLLGTGYALEINEAADIEFSIFSKIGWLFSDNPICNNAWNNNFELSGFNFILGALMDFIFCIDHLCFPLGLEIGGSPTSIKKENYEIRTFPYFLLITLGIGIV